MDVASPPPRRLRPLFSLPLLGVCSCLPLLGAVVAQCADAWGFFTLRRYGPLYIQFVLGVDIAVGGVLPAIPLLCRFSFWHSIWIVNGQDQCWDGTCLKSDWAELAKQLV